MTRTSRRRRRPQGGIEELPSGSLRVYAYSNIDPLSGKKHYLRELIPAGTPDAEREAEKALRRLLSQIDERRHPTTNATLDQLLDRYLETLDVAETTLRMYGKYAEKHIRPFVGRLKAGAVDVETLDSLYAELRCCWIHCDRSRGLVNHRTPREHECDDRCRPHQCNGLSSTTIRHIHFVLRGAYEKGVRWRWVNQHPMQLVDAPGPTRPTRSHRRRRRRRAWSRRRGTTRTGDARLVHDGHRRSPRRALRAALVARRPAERGARDPPRDRAARATRWASRCWIVASDQWNAAEVERELRAAADQVRLIGSDPNPRVDAELIMSWRS